MVHGGGCAPRPRRPEREVRCSRAPPGDGSVTGDRGHRHRPHRWVEPVRPGAPRRWRRPCTAVVRHRRGRQACGPGRGRRGVGRPPRVRGIRLSGSRLHRREAFDTLVEAARSGGTARRRSAATLRRRPVRSAVPSATAMTLLGPDPGRPAVVGGRRRVRRQADLAHREVNPTAGRVERLHRPGIALEVADPPVVEEVVEGEAPVPGEVPTDPGRVPPGQRMVDADATGRGSGPPRPPSGRWCGRRPPPRAGPPPVPGRTARRARCWAITGPPPLRSDRRGRGDAACSPSTCRTPSPAVLKGALRKYGKGESGRSAADATGVQDELGRSSRSRSSAKAILLCTASRGGRRGHRESHAGLETLARHREQPRLLVGGQEARSICRVARTAVQTARR